MSQSEDVITGCVMRPESSQAQTPTILLIPELHISFLALANPFFDLKDDQITEAEFIPRIFGALHGRQSYKEILRDDQN